MTTPKAIDLSSLQLLLEEFGSVVDAGVITTPIVAGGNSLSDSMKSWVPGILINRLLKVTDAKSRREIVQIAGNSLDAIVTRQTWRLNFPAGTQYQIISIDLMQALRDVFGGGSNISAANPLEVHDPKVGSLISYEGTTTANGAGDGSTLVCAALAALPDYDGHWVVVTSGPNIGQATDIIAATTGGVVSANANFDNQVTAGTNFVIIAMKALPAEVAAIEAKLDHAAHGLAALKVLIDAVEAKLDVQKGSTGVFYEQADVAVDITAVNTGETDVLHLSAASTRYIVRSLRLKSVTPGANTITVRLYELENGALTEVDSFAITAANFATHFSLMDMFGLPHLAGDELQVTVRASAGGPYVVTGQYSHGKTNV